MPRVIDNLDNRCMLCGARASYGFGLPPRPTLWACVGHRATVGGLWQPGPYVPLPRTGTPRKPPPSPAAKAVRKLTR
jgi:hypothetical protein